MNGDDIAAVLAFLVREGALRVEVIDGVTRYTLTEKGEAAGVDIYERTRRMDLAMQELEERAVDEPTND